MNDMTKMIAGLVVRHGVTALGALLVQYNVLAKSGEASWVETTAGIVLGIVGIFWSWWQKSGQQEILAKLARMRTSAPVAPPSATNAEAAKLATDLVKAVGAVLLAVLLTAAVALPAMAQVPRKRLTGNVVRDIGNALNPTPSSTASTSNPLDQAIAALAKPFQDIANFIGEDADGAIALATVIPEIQDGHGQQCWMAMASFGKIVKAHPVPLTFHVITDFETLRLLAIATNNLCTNVHCTQVFADGTSMAQAASPVPLMVPTLHDLCTKVPQIAVVAPVSVLAPSAPAAQ